MALVRTNFLEECITTIIMVERISELATTLAATSKLIPSTMMMGTMHSSEMFVISGVTRRHIQEYAILHSHRRDDLKPYRNCELY
jgi:hypothetical protein